MANRLPEFRIQRDTKEHDNKGWFWEPEEKRPGVCQCLGTIEDDLQAGDYTIAGHEDLVIIERKQHWSEIYGQLMTSEGKARFERELEKLVTVKYKAIIIEDVISEGVMGLSVGQVRNGNGAPLKRLVSMLVGYRLDYGIDWIPGNNCGKRIARMIFEQIARRHLS